MPRKSERKTKSQYKKVDDKDKVDEDNEDSNASKENEQIRLLRRKHELELQEFKLRQEKEELDVLLNTSVRSDSKSTTTSKVIGNSTLSPTASNFVPSSLQQDGKDQRSMVETLLKNQEQQAKLVSALQMPKVELQAFNGNPLEFWSFMRLFQSSVECNAVDEVSKLTRLLQYTTGDAKRAIQGCSMMRDPADGYNEAMRILKRRFGSDEIVANAWISKITDGEAIKNNDSKGLRYMADDMQTSYCVLESIGMTNEIDHQRGLLRIVQRLPPFLQTRWRKTVADLKREDRTPRFNDLLRFVISAAEEVNDPTYGTNSLTSKDSAYHDDDHSKGNNKAGFKTDKKGKSSTFARASYAAQAEQPAGELQHCVACNGNHALSKCEKFRQLSSYDRYRVVQDNRLCRNCFLFGHRADSCFSDLTCAKCHKNHNTLLHVEGGPIDKSRNKPPEARAEVTTCASFTSQSCQPTAVKLHPVLPILAVVVKSANYSVATYALLDPGSTHTYCSQELADKLHLTGQDVTMPVTTITGSKVAVNAKLVDFVLSDVKGEREVQVTNAMAKLNLEISTDLIATKEDIERWPHLKDVPLYSLKEAKVNLLIGQDLPEVLKTRSVMEGEPGMPYATETLLGWALNGPMKPVSPLMTDSYFTQHDHDIMLHEQVERFWRLDGDVVSDDCVMSQTDQKVLQLWDSTVHITNGHYVLPIPIKDGADLRATGLATATRRLELLRKRLLKNHDLKVKYTGVMNELFSDGYAEKVPNGEVDTGRPTHYLPHHPVVNANKDKLRIVFDCAAKAEDGTSLNDKVWSGPDLMNRLVGVLLRFREEKVAIVADVKAMFHQVRVAPEHCDMLRFLWWTDENCNTPEVFRMTVHLFGGTWSPSCSSYALRRVAQDRQTAYNEAACNAIRRSFYVDDLLKSVKTEEEAVALAAQLTSMLDQAGFSLNKWLSNSRAVLRSIAPDRRLDSVKSLSDKADVLPLERTLGLYWNVEDDVFQFKIKKPDKPLTRRGILSATSSIFDPCGYLAPFVLIAKLIIQELSRLKLGWDEQVPQEQVNQWKKWEEDLGLLTEFTISRCIKPRSMTSVKSCQLIHFSDASQRAYGAISYARFIDSNDKVHCILLSAKSHLAPLKGQTIPRLELMAAVTAVKQDSLLIAELDIKVNESIFFTDSEIVLHYISNEEKRHCVFVANRISTIRSGSSAAQWHFVPSASNPADELSRGLSAQEILDDKRWLQGPEFLWSHEEFASMTANRAMTMSAQEVEVEAVSFATSTIAVKKKEVAASVIESLFARYSSWTRLRKAVVWLHKFAQFLRQRHVMKMQQSNVASVISVDDLCVAEDAIVCYVQQQEFGLKNQRQTVLKQLANLNPKVNVKGIIVVAGRLQHAAISDSARYPAILPKVHHVTNLVIRHYHELAGHGGVEVTAAMVREKYWIVHTRRSVRRIIASCVTCKRMRPRNLSQLMADLPADRVRGDEPPVTHSGVDLFGPLMVKVGRSTPKRYGCLFTCLQTRAVHIEVASSLDSSSFINCLQRFICRRGNVKSIRSDNGTNFIGAERELKEAVASIDHHKVGQFLLPQQIEWLYNVPGAPHMGGVWERLVRSIKQVLQVLLREQLLDDEGLNTVMCQAEFIVNSRPLSHVSEDASDPQPITPNHLLHLRAPTVFPLGVFDQKDLYSRRRWRQVAYMAEVFWSRWRREYLTTLQCRHKWQQTSRNVKPDDVVLLLNDDALKRQWTLARIIDVRRDSDGCVRAATVKTAAGIFQRPIAKMCLLEESSD